MNSGYHEALWKAHPCKCQQRHREVLLLVVLLILSRAFFVSSCFCLLLVSQCFCWRPAPGGQSSGSKENSTEVPALPAVGNHPEGFYELWALGYMANERTFLKICSLELLVPYLFLSVHLNISPWKHLPMCCCLSALLFLISGHKMLYFHTSWYYFTLHKIYLFKVVWKAQHQILKKEYGNNPSVQWEFLRKPVPFPVL